MNELLRVALLVSGTIVTPAPTALAAVAAPVDVIPVEQHERLHARAADAWLGPDKFRHFWTSYAATAIGFAAARSVGQDGDAALVIGMGFAAVAGIGKEIHDRRGGHLFSLRDLVADALGIGAAYFLLREVR